MYFYNWRDDDLLEAVNFLIEQGANINLKDKVR